MAVHGRGEAAVAPRRGYGGGRCARQGRGDSAHDPELVGEDGGGLCLARELPHLYTGLREQVVRGATPLNGPTQVFKYISFLFLFIFFFFFYATLLFFK